LGLNGKHIESNTTTDNRDRTSVHPHEKIQKSITELFQEKLRNKWSLDKRLAHSHA
jgi:hypothetical protein